MRNNYDIIDSHCHIYPDKIAQKASQSIADFYSLPVAHNGTVKRLIETGTTAGVDRFVVQSVATAPEQVESINRYIAQTARNSGGLITGLGTLHPDAKDIEGDIWLLKQLGLKGVKLHADFQKIAIDDPRCYKIYEILEGDLPVLLHTGDKRYDYSNPRRLIPVLEDFKNLIVIGAHFGGWSVWDEAARHFSGYQNLYVDTSSTFGFFSAEAARSLLAKYDLDRVLFGTDYPMWDAQDELDFLFGLNLTDLQYRKLLSENCCRVYGI